MLGNKFWELQVIDRPKKQSIEIVITTHPLIHAYITLWAVIEMKQPSYTNDYKIKR